MIRKLASRVIAAVFALRLVFVMFISVSIDRVEPHVHAAINYLQMGMQQYAERDYTNIWSD